MRAAASRLERLGKAVSLVGFVAGPAVWYFHLWTAPDIGFWSKLYLFLLTVFQAQVLFGAVCALPGYMITLLAWWLQSRSLNVPFRSMLEDPQVKKR